MSELQYVVDENGSRYTLAHRLGSGGQGSVYALAGGRFAVKILLDRSAIRRESLREQLAHVRRLDLASLPIARPLTLLRRPHVGYIMDLLTGMQPLQRLLAPPKDAGSTLAWYHETGGLRRRLLLLTRIAEALSAVHGKGLAYGDPSPHNVFVSETVSEAEVRLIDADNLRFTSTPAVSTLHTPGYGAPELVRGTGSINTLTDAHGFAVMAFEGLTLAHPLLGDAIRAGDPDGEFSALAGELPWIDHTSDDRNRSSVGLMREAVLSPRLRELCEESFGPGLRNPEARPGLARWAEQLSIAANSTLRCPRCRWTYYFTQERCPSCDAPRPRFALALFHLWDPAEGGLLPKAPASGATASPPRTVGFAVVDEQDTLTFTRGLALGRDDAAPILRIALRGDRLELAAERGSSLELLDPTTSSPRPLTERPTTIRLALGHNPHTVHFGPQGALHRVLRFQLEPGVAR